MKIIETLKKFFKTIYIFFSSSLILKNLISYSNNFSVKHICRIFSIKNILNLLKILLISNNFILIPKIFAKSKDLKEDTNNNFYDLSKIFIIKSNTLKKSLSINTEGGQIINFSNNVNEILVFKVFDGEKLKEGKNNIENKKSDPGFVIATNINKKLGDYLKGSDSKNLMTKEDITHTLCLSSNEEILNLCNYPLKMSSTPVAFRFESAPGFITIKTGSRCLKLTNSEKSDKNKEKDAKNGEKDDKNKYIVESEICEENRKEDYGFQLINMNNIDKDSLEFTKLNKNGNFEKTNLKYSDETEDYENGTKIFFENEKFKINKVIFNENKKNGKIKIIIKGYKD